MTPEIEHALQALGQSGWTVRESADRKQLPRELTSRYPWIPDDYREVADVAISPDDRAWMLTVPDFRGTGKSAYAWNEWELLSLKSAGEDDDLDWMSRIRSFWDNHLPIMLSVKTGYAYFAIRRSDLQIVCGEEPEFEETFDLAASFFDLVTMICSQSKDVELWV